MENDAWIRGKARFNSSVDDELARSAAMKNNLTNFLILSL